MAGEISAIWSGRPAKNIAVDVLRTATEPVTAGQIAAAILAKEGIKATKEDVQSVQLGIQHSLKNHEGKGVEIVGEARPAGWQICP
jgi:hypothetical protein